MSKKRQTLASSAEAAAILLAQASVCLDLAAKSREFWVTASLIDLARELARAYLQQHEPTNEALNRRLQVMRLA
jgi:hypothetical protein